MTPLAGKGGDDCCQYSSMSEKQGLIGAQSSRLRIKLHYQHVQHTAVALYAAQQA